MIFSLSSVTRKCRGVALTTLIFPLMLLTLRAGTLSVSSSTAGVTPDIVGYNLAHFYTGGNTPAWIRYSGITGARIFMSPSALGEYFGHDDISPWGDGVSDQAGFVARKSALRTSQLTVGTSGTGPYINWTYFTNLYTQNIGSSNNASNQIVPVEAMSQLRSMNIDVLVNITASPGSFPIASDSDWAGKWELWQHFYAQAFYLAKNYDVKRYQMYNEPDNATNGLPGNANFTDMTDFMMRLKLASDAIQSAVADVNAKYAKSLSPEVLAPVTTHGDTDYFGTGAGQDWGHTVVNSRHTDYLGQTSSNYLLMHQYDFHKYGSTASDYDATITTLEGYIAADMPGETPFTVSVSEFNTHTAAQFDTLAATLDSPAEYATFGSIGVHLLKSTPGELYCFKFGQTLRSGTSESDPLGTVQKNGMHYVDNWNPPYNVGGITKAGEVWRLINKGFAPGRSLLSYTRPSDGSLDAVGFKASYDPVLKRYYLLSVNDSASSVTMTVNTSAWNLPVGNKFLLEEVSESRFGGPHTWGTVGAGNILLSGASNTFVQPSNTVWLFTLPTAIQGPEQIVTVTDDATVKDGGNATTKYGTATSLTVKNTTTATPSARNAALLKFKLPAGVNISDIQLAVLSVNASLLTGSNFTATSSDAHVYGLPNTNSTWTQSAVTWNTAPNLNLSAPGGPSISNNFVTGGDATLTSGNAAMLCGQMVVTGTAQAEYLVDVTNFLRAQTINDHDASILLAREVRYYGDPVDTDGISIVSQEGSSSSTSPRLKLVLKSNTNLSSLTSSVGSLTPAFSATVTSYAATVANAVTTATVTPTCSDSTCTLQVRVNNGSYTTLASGSTSSALALNVGTNPIDIKVTALDGVSTTTYTLTVTRASNANVNLSALSMSAGTLVPAFSSGTTSYSSSVPSNTSSITVSPTSVDSTSVIKVRVNGSSYQTVISGSNSSALPLGGGANTVDVTVTSQNGLTSKTYTVIVTVPTSQLTVTTEATVDSGTPATDVDEAAKGYMRTKYDSNLSACRKAYFQFDLTGLNVNPNASATFTINFTDNFAQRVQLWGLNQTYPGFTSTATWNNAQANDKLSNSMLTSGSFTATNVLVSGSTSVLINPGASLTPYTFTIPRIGDFLLGSRVTLVLTSTNDNANSSSGLRMVRNSSVLQYSLLNTAPTITAFADQTIASGSSTGALAFTVGDSETAAGALTVSGSSSNTTLVPNVNILFSGSNSNRTVSITPAATLSGTSTITVSVSDGALTTGTSFVLSVDPPITTWKKNQFGANWANVAISGDLADPEKDGIANLLEYALNLSPNLMSVTGLPTSGSVLVSGSTYVALAYTRVKSATDITYLVEVSGDLSNWSSGPSYTLQTGSTDSGSTASVVVRDLTPISPSNPKRFIRLKITRP